MTLAKNVERLGRDLAIIQTPHRFLFPELAEQRGFRQARSARQELFSVTLW